MVVGLYISAGAFVVAGLVQIKLDVSTNLLVASEKNWQIAYAHINLHIRTSEYKLNLRIFTV